MGCVSVDLCTIKVRTAHERGRALFSEKTEVAMGKVSSLPKLVVGTDFDRVVRLAASGDLERLKATIDSSLKRSRAKLHTPAESKDDPPSITLCMPVVQATWGGHTPVVSYLVANFSDVVQNEDEESLPLPPYFLLDEKLWCCEEDSGSHTHRHGPYIASHIAASVGSVDILRLWGNLCVGWRDDLGRTPLHWAAFYDQNEAVQYLLSVGALASATTDCGVTPLLDCIMGLESRREVHFEVFMNLLRSGGEMEHSYASDIIDILQYTSAEEKAALLTIFLQAKGETMVLLGKMFQLVCIASHNRTVAKEDLNPIRSFIDGLCLLSCFCEDLSWLKAIWERIFQVGSEHNITVSYLPPIQVYEGRTEVTSWKEADLMLSQASSDPSEVIYQCGIMLESVLGYDSPYLIETLCNAPATPTLGQDQPSKALVHLFSRGIKLLNQYLNSNKPFLDLSSPVNYFDDLVRSGHTLNLALPLQLLLETLVLLQDQMKQLEVIRTHFPSYEQKKLEEWKKSPSFIAFDLLCRMAYIAHKKDGSSSRMLPHQIDEFGQRLLQLSPNIDIYHRISSTIPPWIEEDDKRDYDEFVSECFKSWVESSGALYALDSDGKLPIDQLIETMFSYRIPFYKDDYVYSSVHQSLIDVVLEYGTHPDAVNSSNMTPFESLHSGQLLEASEGSTKAAVKDAITKPSVPPLECLTARALVGYQFPYQTLAASDYLPYHLLQFISIHDPKRSKNVFTHTFLKN